MNYYPFHIGDYAAHTQRLSLMEDLAYRRLIDAYYLAERPFNGSSTDVAREIGMIDQLQAVEYVLGKFFEAVDGGFANRRCDKEIAHFHDKQVKASNAGKASAERRLKQKSTDVGKVATDVQPTNNQEPITKINTKTVTPPDGVSIKVWADFLKIRKAQKAPVTDTAIEGIRREAGKAGVTLEDALRTCVERGWRGFKADWVEKQPMVVNGLIPGAI